MVYANFALALLYLSPPICTEVNAEPPLLPRDECLSFARKALENFAVLWNVMHTWLLCLGAAENVPHAPADVGKGRDGNVIPVHGVAVTAHNERDTELVFLHKKRMMDLDFETARKRQRLELEKLETDHAAEMARKRAPKACASMGSASLRTLPCPRALNSTDGSLRHSSLSAYVREMPLVSF